MKPNIEIFCEGLDHPEGLAFAPDGSLYCGGEAGQIYRVAPDGKKVETVGNTGGFNLGLAFSPAGWLAICDGRKNCVWKYEQSSGALAVWAQESGGRALSGMNFPVFDSLGNLFASENGRWGCSEGVIHRFSPEGVGTPWVEGLRFANGLAMNKSQTAVYVVQSTEDNVLRVPVMENNVAGEPEVFVSGVSHVPDGLAFDVEGNLLVSCYGDNAIWKVDLHGNKELLTIDPTSMLLNRATNIAFRGIGGETLYVANLGGYHIASIDLGSHGQPLAGGLQL